MPRPVTSKETNLRCLIQQIRARDRPAAGTAGLVTCSPKER
jgi:hypothetical protein